MRGNTLDVPIQASEVHAGSSSPPLPTFLDTVESSFGLISRGGSSVDTGSELLFNQGKTFFT